MRSGWLRQSLRLLVQALVGHAETLPQSLSAAEVRVGPRANDPPRAFGLARTGEQMLGALQGHEAPRVPRGAEDVAGVLDAHGVVGGRVQDQKWELERPDLVVQVGGADVFDECPFEG